MSSPSNHLIDFEISKKQKLLERFDKQMQAYRNFYFQPENIDLSTFARGTSILNKGVKPDSFSEEEAEVSSWYQYRRVGVEEYRIKLIPN